jgi:hypothetical protein
MHSFPCLNYFEYFYRLLFVKCFILEDFSYVNIPILEIIFIIFLSAHSNVAFIIKPNLWRFKILDKNPLSDVKFSSIYQKRFFQVFLDNVLTLASNDIIHNFIQIIKTFYSSASR